VLVAAAVVRLPAFMLTPPAEAQPAGAPLVLARVVIGGGAPRPTERSRRLRADSTDNVVFDEDANRPLRRGAPPLLLDDTCRATLLRDVNEPPLRPGDIGLPTDCADCCNGLVDDAVGVSSVRVRTGLGGKRSGVDDIIGEECLFFGDEDRITEPPMAELPQGVFTLLVLPPSAVAIITLFPGCRTIRSCPFLAAAAAPNQASSCGRPGVRDEGEVGGRGEDTSGEATTGGLCAGPSAGEGECTRKRRTGSDVAELPITGEETSRRTFVDGELQGGGAPTIA